MYSSFDEFMVESEDGELLRTELSPHLEPGPEMSTAEIASRNFNNQYEREYDGISIGQQWVRLMMGDTSMDESNWSLAVGHLMRLVAFYTDDVDQVMALYRRSRLSWPPDKEEEREYRSRESVRTAYWAINVRNKRYHPRAGASDNRVDSRDYREDIETNQPSSKTSWSRSLDPDLDQSRRVLMTDYMNQFATPWVKADIAEVARLLEVTPRHCRRLLQRWIREGLLIRDYRRVEGRGKSYFIQLRVMDSEVLCPLYSHVNQHITVVADPTLVTADEKAAELLWFQLNAAGDDYDLSLDVSPIDEPRLTERERFMEQYLKEVAILQVKGKIGWEFDDQRISEPWYEGTIPVWAQGYTEDILFYEDRQRQRLTDKLTEYDMSITP